MDPKILEILDKAIKAGGNNLSRSAIVTGNSNHTKELLNKMCSSGLLEQSTDGRPKFTVTPKGCEAWKSHASEDQRKEVEELEKKKYHKELLEFLCLVKKRMQIMH